MNSKTKKMNGVLTDVNPYAPPTAPQQQHPLIYESTRCRIHRFWPECEVTLYEDRLELTSATLVPRTIPVEQIVRLSSRRFLWHRHLIFDFTDECELDQLRVQSLCPSRWYDALADHDVPTEDEFNFRQSKQVAGKLLLGLGGVAWLVGLIFFAALVLAFAFGTK